MINYILKARKDIYPNLSIRNIYNSLLFIFKCFLHFSTIAEFIKTIKMTHYSHILSVSPNVLGFVVWPYIHNQWPTKKRFEAISTHYQLLEKLPKYLGSADATPIQLIDLNHYSEKLYVVIDKPEWFIREGEITVNLFKNDLRVMSIAFSFGYSEKGLTIFIGCVQGIHSGVSSAESLGILKNLTKDLDGLRPRNLLIQVVQMIGLSVGVKAIRGISESNRQHRHRYFKQYLATISSANYDDIWLDIKGIKLEDGFFELPINSKRRGLSDISSNKRAQYRRRYLMLDNIKQQISNLSKLQDKFS